MPDEDLALLERWRTGDRAAGKALFERYFESVFRFLRNKVDEDANDLVQQVFLACEEGRTRFRAESSFRTYLFRWRGRSWPSTGATEPAATPSTSV